jgi:hypothetical protein
VHVFRKVTPISLFLLYLLATVQASATQLRIVVIDTSGAPLPDQLVIVRSLDTANEVFRALSNPNGKVFDHDVPPGPYQAISTHPYGSWETKVVEFLVGTAPTSLALRIQPTGTHGYGDVVWVGPRRPELKLKFEDAAGKPVPMVSFFVRDREAQHWFWSKSNDRGEETFRSDDWQLVDSRGGVTIVSIWKARLVKTDLTAEALAAAHKSGKPIMIELESGTNP